MGLIQFANSTHCCKELPATMWRSSGPDDCFFNGNTLAPAATRVMNGNRHGLAHHDTQGDHARGMRARELFDGVMAPDANPNIGKGDNSKIFSLPQGLLTIWKSGSHKTADLQDYFYFDHPNNSGGSTGPNSLVQYKKCGSGFTQVKHTIEAFNAMVHRCHGSPPPGTAKYAVMEGYCFTPEDGKKTLAAISRIVHVDKARAEREGQLFFINASATATNTLPPRRRRPLQTHWPSEGRGYRGSVCCMGGVQCPQRRRQAPEGGYTEEGADGADWGAIR